MPRLLLIVRSKIATFGIVAVEFFPRRRTTALEPELCVDHTIEKGTAQIAAAVGIGAHSVASSISVGGGRSEVVAKRWRDVFGAPVDADTLCQPRQR